MIALRALFIRDLRLAGRTGGGTGGVVFLLALATLVPFALGPDLALLARIGPALIWIGALLATLLGLDQLFGADADDGSLDLLRLGALPLEAVVLVKAAAHWLTTCVPLVVAAPFVALLFGVETERLPMLCLSLALGTPALTMIGATAAAATVSLRRGALLLPLLVMPLAVPVLIFGVAANDATQAVSLASPALLLLVSTSLAALALAPFAAAAALRAAPTVMA